MPLTRIALGAGKPPAYRRALPAEVYLAMTETFAVPENDLFITVSEHGPDDFHYGDRYLGVARSDDLVTIQATVSNMRSAAQKFALFRRIVERLGANPGVRPEDVLISLVEVAKENWSLGNGQAQYA
ncbi:MAG: tautomerase family protein [Rhodobacteraceae bacterium]|nr:tautomerase family protein [Paracoccaceae bacterium]